MNIVSLIGRLTADPEVRHTTGAEAIPIARYTLAVDRQYKREGQPTADFLSCKVIGKGADFVEKYLRKGMKIAVTGRIEVSSYEQDGQKRTYTSIIVNTHEFCESKSSSEQGNNYQGSQQKKQTQDDDFPY